MFCRRCDYRWYPTLWNAHPDQKRGEGWICICPDCGIEFHATDKEMEGIQMQFDFETWWAGIFNHGCTGSPLCALKPLYEKMREWGWDIIKIDWLKKHITVCRYSGEENSLGFTVNGINAFPDTLKEAFKWMYENRVNKSKEKCDSEGPCERYERESKDLDMARQMWEGPRGASGVCPYNVAMKQLRDAIYCPFCGQRRIG